MLDDILTFHPILLLLLTAMPCAAACWSVARMASAIERRARRGGKQT